MKWNGKRKDDVTKEKEEEEEEKHRVGSVREAHWGRSDSGEGRDATSATTTTKKRVPGANADDSSFLASVGYFRPVTIFERDSSRGFAAVLVRVCARWPAQHTVAAVLRIVVGKPPRRQEKPVLRKLRSTRATLEFFFPHLLIR
ncbi:hypothetical protein ANTPLA_LOCUS522 [Anthophora plagiata]